MSKQPKYSIYNDVGLPIADDLSFQEAFFKETSLLALKPHRVKPRPNASMDLNLPELVRAYELSSGELERIQRELGASSSDPNDLRSSVRQVFNVAAAPKEKKKEVGMQVNAYLTRINEAAIKQASLALQVVAERIAQSIKRESKRKVRVSPSLVSELVRSRADKFASLLPNPTQGALNSKQEEFIAQAIEFLALFIDPTQQEPDDQFFPTLALFKAAHIDVLFDKLSKIDVENGAGSHYATPALQALLIISRYTNDEDFGAFVESIPNRSEQISKALDRATLAGNTYDFSAFAELYQANPTTASSIAIACRAVLGDLVAGDFRPGVGLDNNDILSILKKRGDIPNLKARVGLFKTISSVAGAARDIPADILVSVLSGATTNANLAKSLNAKTKAKAELKSSVLFTNYISCEEIGDDTPYIEWALELFLLWAGENNPPAFRSMGDWRPYVDAYKQAYSRVGALTQLVDSLKSPDINKVWQAEIYNTVMGFMANEDVDRALKRDALHTPISDGNITNVTRLLSEPQGDLFRGLFSRPIADPLLLLMFAAVELPKAVLSNASLLSAQKLQTTLSKNNVESWVSVRYNPLNLISGLPPVSDCCVMTFYVGSAHALLQFLLGPPKHMAKLPIAERGLYAYTVYHIARDFEEIPNEPICILGTSLYYPAKLPTGSLKDLPDESSAFVYATDGINFVVKGDSVRSPLLKQENPSVLASDGFEPRKRDIESLTVAQINKIVSHERLATQASPEFSKVYALSETGRRTDYDTQAKARGYVEKGDYGISSEVPTPTYQVYYDFQGSKITLAAAEFFGSHIAEPARENENLEIFILSDGSAKVSYDGAEPVAVSKEVLQYIFSWPKGFTFLPKGAIIFYTDTTSEAEAEAAIQLLYPSWFVTDKPLNYNGRMYTTTDMHKVRSPKRFLLCDTNKNCVDLNALHRETMHKPITRSALSKHSVQI